MSVQNLPNYTNDRRLPNAFEGTALLGGEDHHAEPSPPCQRLLEAVSRIVLIGQLIFSCIGVANVFDEPFLGRTLALLGAAFIIFSALAFISRNKESRTTKKLNKFIYIPIYLETGPMTCGLLAANGILTSRTASLVNLGSIVIYNCSLAWYDHYHRSIQINDYHRQRSDDSDRINLLRAQLGEE